MTEIQIEFDVPATMGDGTVLRADVYRPGGTGPWPVLPCRLPYGKQVPMVAVVLDPLAGGPARLHGRHPGHPWPVRVRRTVGAVDLRTERRLRHRPVGRCPSRFERFRRHVRRSYFGNTQWMAALSKPPELKAIAPSITWADPDDGLFSRGGAIELGITVPRSLLQGADALMRRHRTDLAGLQTSIAGLVHDLDGLATGGYAELPAGRFPAFARHDLPELGYERSRREPGWAQSCRVAGRHDEINLPTFQVGGWYDIFCQGTLDNFTAMHPVARRLAEDLRLPVLLGNEAAAAAIGEYWRSVRCRGRRTAGTVRLPLPGA